MSQNAPDVISRQALFSRQAIDPRADGATRLVHVSASSVTIERVLRGVRMRVGVPVSAYQGLVLSVRHASATATLALRHDDAELDVALGSGDAMDLARRAKEWSDRLGQPILIEEACVTMHAPLCRRAKRAVSPRRLAFARRRKTGIDRLADTSFAHEHEIIARD